jgi:Undecaprenyl-phosphate galactose phosphotransferase WbaP
MPSQLGAATVAAELSARTSAFRFGPSGDPAELIALTPRADLPRIDVARPNAGSTGAFAGRPSTALTHTRLFDIVCAAFALILLLPVLLFAVIAIRLSSPGPVFFVQHRVGRNGKSFPCLKFRSMVVDAQQRLDALLATSEEARREWALDQKLRSDPRITPIGQLLRKTSLDELPQLLNVLAGHMSIVGPRPIVENEIVRYGSRFTAYCAVRPGLTGLWQVSGRNEVSYETRVRLDAFYAARKSLAYDLTICFRTIPAVLLSRGCY